MLDGGIRYTADFFFFSSRRRHTRFDCDWSSDVCSSDLMLVPITQPGGPLLDIADYHLALLLNQQGAFEVAQEILMRVARKVHNNPEMMFAAGLPALRMPILPSDIPANQRDIVTMAGKAFWDLATQSPEEAEGDLRALVDRKSTRLNSSHSQISYAVFCLKKKKKRCTTWTSKRS